MFTIYNDNSIKVKTGKMCELNETKSKNSSDTLRNNIQRICQLYLV